jgi:drug/metabolite transporter (DMT)-like permease
MFVVFGVGTLLLYLAFREAFHIPNRVELFYLLLGATMAIAGQYLLTMGFRYVTPVKGGILSSTRILIAAFLGSYITSDPPLRLSSWIGAVLILATNLYFIIHKSNSSQE